MATPTKADREKACWAVCQEKEEGCELRGCSQTQRVSQAFADERDLWQPKLMGGCSGFCRKRKLKDDMYRCFHCEAYFCSECARSHFGVEPACIKAEREAAYRAGQENLAAMKAEIQSVYDQVCLIPERPKTTQAFINGLARAMVILGMKEPIPHGGDYCVEPPPSEGKA